MLIVAGNGERRLPAREQGFAGRQHFNPGQPRRLDVLAGVGRAQQDHLLGELDVGLAERRLKV